MIIRIHESKIILFEAAKESLVKQISPMLLSSISKQKEKLANQSAKSQNFNLELKEQQVTIFQLNQHEVIWEHIKPASRENREKIH